MIGIFDSGVGGFIAIDALRKTAPDLNICFFADRKNAPYGTKTLREITELSKRNIEKLVSLGAEKILIACCTASAAYPYLSEDEKQICVPIINLGAKRAVEISKNGRIGVIATERTVKERAFFKAVSERPLRNFVTLVENGARDGELNERDKLAIEEKLSPFHDKKIDTLILGCTHFPHIEKEIQKVLGVRTVNPAFEGALEIVKDAHLSEEGRTVYI